MTDTAIITITLNPALDISSSAPQVIPDRKLRCAAPRIQPGGGGVNVARVVRALGGDPLAVVAVGGAEGRALVGAMREAGLRVERIRLTQATRSSLSVIDTKTGAQYRFVMPGPEWTQAECNRAQDVINAVAKPGDFIVPSGSMPPGVPPGFFNDIAAQSAGRQMILDTSGRALAEAAQRSGLHTLRMDDVEAAELAGQAMQDPRDIALFARSLWARGAARIVMIAAGAQGNVIATDRGCWLCVPPVVEVVSKTGAGDSFVAGYTLALARGASPLEACVVGTGAAAAACETPDSDLCAGPAAAARAKAVRVEEITDASSV